MQGASRRQTDEKRGVGVDSGRGTGQYAACREYNRRAVRKTIVARPEPAIASIATLDDRMPRAITRLANALTNMDESPSETLSNIDGTAGKPIGARSASSSARRLGERSDLRRHTRTIRPAGEDAAQRDVIHSTGSNQPIQLIRTTRYRPTWVFVGLTGLAAIVYVHLTGGPHHVLTFHTHADKLEHIFAFAAAMLWFGQLYRRGMERSLVCICLILTGIVLEYVQHALGHYDPVEYGDMAADGIGACLGWLLLRTRLDHVIERIDRWLARLRAD